MPSNYISGGVWNIHCFGGPLHQQESEAEEGQSSFRAVIRRHSPIPVLRVQRELHTIRAAHLEAVNYMIVESTFACGSNTRRIRCGVADNITRMEIIAYRDFLHSELARFELEVHQMRGGQTLAEYLRIRG